MIRADLLRKAVISEALHVKDEVLPVGWRWVKLGDVCTMTNGRAFKPSEWCKRKAAADILIQATAPLVLP